MFLCLLCSARIPGFQRQRSRGLKTCSHMLTRFSQSFRQQPLAQAARKAHQDLIESKFVQVAMDAQGCRAAWRCDHPCSGEMTYVSACR